MSDKLFFFQWKFIQMIHFRWRRSDAVRDAAEAVVIDINIWMQLDEEIGSARRHQSLGSGARHVTSSAAIFFSIFSVSFISFFWGYF